MFCDPFKQDFYKTAYDYMFKEPSKRTLTIIAFAYMF